MKKINIGMFVVALTVGLFAPRRADSLSCAPCGEVLELVSATEDGVDIRDRLADGYTQLSAGYDNGPLDPTLLCIGYECLTLVRR